MSEEKKQRLKEYQRNYHKAKKKKLFIFLSLFFYLYIFFHCIKMRKELVFKIKNNIYTKDKYHFQKDKNPININEVDTEEKLLSNKTSYGEHGAYLSSVFKPLHIIIKDIILYTNHMNVLADDTELLKYNEIWNKIEALFNKKSNKKGLHNRPVYNNEYIKTKISSYNENFHDNKKLTKDEYYGHSILLLE